MVCRDDLPSSLSWALPDFFPTMLACWVTRSLVGWDMVNKRIGTRSLYEGMQEDWYGPTELGGKPVGQIVNAAERSFMAKSLSITPRAQLAKLATREYSASTIRILSPSSNLLNFHSLLDLAARRVLPDHHGKGAVVRDGVRSSPGDPSRQGDQLRSHCEADWTT